jgi:hypothetical protein
MRTRPAGTVLPSASDPPEAWLVAVGVDCPTWAGLDAGGRARRIKEAFGLDAPEVVALGVARLDAACAAAVARARLADTVAAPAAQPCPTYRARFLTWDAFDEAQRAAGPACPISADYQPLAPRGSVAADCPVWLASTPRFATWAEFDAAQARAPGCPIPAQFAPAAPRALTTPQPAPDATEPRVLGMPRDVAVGVGVSLGVGLVLLVAGELVHRAFSPPAPRARRAPARNPSRRRRPRRHRPRRHSRRAAA